jgi:hypothetical protein
MHKAYLLIKRNKKSEERRRERDEEGDTFFSTNSLSHSLSFDAMSY